MKTLFALSYDEVANGLCIYDILSLVERNADFVVNGINSPLIVLFISETREQCQSLSNLLVLRSGWKEKILNRYSEPIPYPEPEESFEPNHD